jgi:sugar O-acyltransferase (sialic acid O-acetyltransferase NeuD family)
VTAELVVVGCGGHGRELAQIADVINQASPDGPRWHLLGFVDDHPSEVNLKAVRRLELSYLGPVDRLLEVPGCQVALGIGDSRTRRRVGHRIDGYGMPSASLIHPAATLGADVVAGDGLVAFAGARVTTNVTLGRHVHLNQNCTIGHDCVLADYVSVNPLAAVSGDCKLETGVLIGTTAAVLQGIRVGADSTVGAGACVVREVPTGTVVKGVPAR